MCSGFLDLEPVSKRAGFRSNSIQMLCAILLDKRFDRPQERKAIAAHVSRDVAIKLGPLWISEAFVNGATASAKELKLLSTAGTMLNEQEIEHLKPVEVNSNVQVVLTTDEARTCVQKILTVAKHAGGDLSKRIVGFDVEFVPGDNKSQPHVPTVIQVCCCSISVAPGPNTRPKALP